jgi:hypothetical protein
VYAFVFMALHAFLFIREKVVCLGCMTLLAVNSFHKYMPRMTIRFSHGDGALFSFTEVTVFAAFPGGDAAVVLFNLAIAPCEDIRKKEFVLAQQAH